MLDDPLVHVVVDDDLLARHLDRELHVGLLRETVLGRLLRDDLVVDQDLAHSRAQLDRVLRPARGLLPDDELDTLPRDRDAVHGRDRPVPGRRCGRRGRRGRLRRLLGRQLRLCERKRRDYECGGRCHPKTAVHSFPFMILRF
jgi:hypothetical protein